jgi:hypothetical protein
LLVASFIKLVEEVTSLSPIVVVSKKNGKFRICVDFKKLKATTKKDPYPLPFTNEVINMVARHEVYTFLDGFSRYHHISIALKDQHKIAFITDWGAFVWVVMPFGVKNGPPIYQRVVIKAFCEYINVFTKIFQDEFIIFNDMSTHLEKFIKCFLKCIEYGISLNLEKCAFAVCFRTILGFIVSKEGKTPNPKKIEAIVKMPMLKHPRRFKFSMEWPSFIDASLEILPLLWHQSPS